ncbi:acetate/propionate family kinase [Nitrosomonas supralitoralis]|uniref:Acetate kinase n=1 Tax=Nitrosomonas supralitoralis TaxID=2116706 RepID=A0A2P7NSN4_9PROT|nr:acetate/propionate family kinase [Nitrosomonas supralitoralis]PSJ16476.1 acetate kinase [Nitrosomonas supralitoralis]
MSNATLVINAGSSSIKFAVFSLAENTVSLHMIYRGEIVGIGYRPHFTVHDCTGEIVSVAKQSLITENIRSHADAFFVLFDWINHSLSEFLFIAVGHRVVHGGEKYSIPVVVSEEILCNLKEFIPLAPLHQPYEIAAIETLTQQQPEMRQVACFDTAFHRTQPIIAQQFSLPREFRQQGILKYGFHGLSYEYIASVLPEYLGSAAEGRVIVAHLGHGASMCAMKARRSVATTMTFSPLDGLPMGTRCGAIDPAVVLYLMKEKGMDIDAVADLLNYRSGLLGVSGISGDMRELLANDNPHAAEAIDLFVYCAGRELGSLAAALGGLDALVFTAGIGEHSVVIRERICREAAWLGIRVDETANAANNSRISTMDSSVSAWMIPTNEELIIAEHTIRVIGGNLHCG